MKSYSFVKILRPSIRMFMYLSPLGIIISFKLNCSESSASICIIMMSDDFTFIGHLIGQIIACLKASLTSVISWCWSLTGANVSLVTYEDSYRTGCCDEVVVCRNPAVFLMFERLVRTVSAWKLSRIKKFLHLIEISLAESMYLICSNLNPYKMSSVRKELS